MTASKRRTLVITSAIFICFGLWGVYAAITTFPYLTEFDITNPASLSWFVYYGLLLVGSLIYLAMGFSGVIFREKIERHKLIRGLCIAALVYIVVASILWFAAYARFYDEHIAVAIIEISLGLVGCYFIYSSTC